MKSKLKTLVKGLTLGSLLFTSSAYAYTCQEAKGYSDALKKGSAVINGVTVEGETILVGEQLSVEQMEIKQTKEFY